jgi:sterol desaturase/sphingolipid hydroxylase (fatty acid hydroxylase superfamily)
MVNFLKPDTWPQLVLLIGSRYFIIATIFWLVWYVIRRPKVMHKKIQPRLPKSADYRREIGYSLMSILIFSAFPASMLLTPFRQYTMYYSSISQHSMLWFWLAFPITFIVHDAYFYWMHRLMHHPKLFKVFHLVHHKSTNPSPWAALSFHPLEAVVEAGIFAVLLMIMPLHAIHLAVFFAGQMLFNVYGHLGWELYSSRFTNSAIGKWINTSRAHNAHHQYFVGNYGLYFLWWDRWCGTLRSDNKDKKVEAVASLKEKFPMHTLHRELSEQEL